MPTYYKTLNAKGRSCHGGTLKWSLPRWNATAETWTPGAWMPKIEGPIDACVSGYHAAAGATQLLEWLHERVYIIESRSPWIDASDKVVTTGPVRLLAGTAWNDCTARLFTVSCALDVLPIWEKAYPDDPRVSDAIIAAWEDAYGEIGDTALAAALAAAGAAASASAWDAWDARDSAWDAGAAWAAWASARATWATGGAARAAAWAARDARDAAWAARDAWDAERDAQGVRLARWLTDGPDI